MRAKFRLLGHILTIYRLFRLFVGKFSGFKFLQAPSEKGSPALDNNATYIYEAEDDLDQCLYYLRTLSNILRWSSDSMWTTLSEKTILTDRANPTLYRISKYLFSLERSNILTRSSGP